MNFIHDCKTNKVLSPTVISFYSLFIIVCIRFSHAVELEIEELILGQKASDLIAKMCCTPTSVVYIFSNLHKLQWRTYFHVVYNILLFPYYTLINLQLSLLHTLWLHVHTYCTWRCTSLTNNLEKNNMSWCFMQRWYSESWPIKRQTRKLMFYLYTWAPSYKELRLLSINHKSTNRSQVCSLLYVMTMVAIDINRK